MIQSFSTSGVTLLKGSLEDEESQILALKQVDVVICSIPSKRVLSKFLGLLLQQQEQKTYQIWLLVRESPLSPLISSKRTSSLNQRLDMEKPELCDELSLESVRKCLIRQEDTIVFFLIERAKYPRNLSAYKPSSGSSFPGFSGSLVEYIVRKTEIL